MEHAPALTRIICYVHNLDAVAVWYQTHFGFQAVVIPQEAMIHLIAPAEGCTITLLKASKGQKRGQSLVKLVFTVPDVAAFKQACAARGLDFGPIHQGNGYAFANVRDPADNLVQISSRHVPAVAAPDA